MFPGSLEYPCPLIAMFWFGWSWCCSIHLSEYPALRSRSRSFTLRFFLRSEAEYGGETTSASTTPSSWESLRASPLITVISPFMSIGASSIFCLRPFCQSTNFPSSSTVTTFRPSGAPTAAVVPAPLMGSRIVSPGFVYLVMRYSQKPTCILAGWATASGFFPSDLGK